MHGMHVHKAVKESGAKKTGMSIHLVDLEYDKGKILFQSTCPVWESDSESDIAARVLKLEHLHYSLVAEQYITSKKEK
jgi:phosphoribosylglycinamide formyltransferase-1